MNYSRLGTSDLKISEVSFGCMSLEHNQKVNSELLRKAFDYGINFFDTADLYDRGLNEEMVGRALKPIREKVLIATKVGNVWKQDGSGWDWNPTKKHLLSAIDESLARLQTDYIDLYQLHGGTIDDPIDDIIEAFELLKEKGKIRAYGISSIRPNVIRQYVDRSNIDSVMMQYSLLDRRPEEFCLNLLHEHKISAITRGSLAKGILIDKPPREYLDYSEKEVAHLQKKILETENPIGASIQFVLDHPAVASAVIGIRTSQQLEQIMARCDQQISNKSLQLLQKILVPKIYENHR